MRLLWVALLCLALLTQPAAARNDLPVRTVGRTSAAEQLIIVLKPEANGEHYLSLADTAAGLRRYGLLELEPLGIDGAIPGAAAYLGAPSAGVNLAELRDKLAHSPAVLSVEPNVTRSVLSIDPPTGPLDHYFSNQTYYFTIGAVEMWSRGLTGMRQDHPITIAVIDTGVDLSHPDIIANLVPGYDFVDLDTVPQDTSATSHGTLVAGVIAAEINNDLAVGVARGVAGIGGGDKAEGTAGLRVMPLRVAAESTGTECSTIAQAIDYARTHGAMVINLSIAGDEPCALEEAAVQRAYDAGLAIVAGAGNLGSQTPLYPAAYGTPAHPSLVIAVAGLDPSGAKADASSYGPWVDLAAPFRVYSLNRAGGYGPASGTSYAAPFVSGLLGVLLSNNGRPRDQIIQQILVTADTIDEQNPEYIGLLGAGRIDADGASRFTQAIYLPLLAQN